MAEALRDGQRGGVTIREVFEPAAIPLPVEQAVIAAYRTIGGGPVAVRSSATAEDLPAAAFAGQQDTLLNVIGAEALLPATVPAGPRYGPNAPSPTAIGRESTSKR